MIKLTCVFPGMLLLATARFMAIFGTVDWRGAGFAWYWFIALGANASWFCCGTAALSDWAWSRNHDVKLINYMHSFCVNVNPTAKTWGESWPREPGVTLVFFPFFPWVPSPSATNLQNPQMHQWKQSSVNWKTTQIISTDIWRYWINCALIITDK